MILAKAVLVSYLTLYGSNTKNGKIVTIFKIKRNSVSINNIPFDLTTGKVKSSSASSSFPSPKVKGDTKAEEQGH
jgi:hypothetical protein